MTPSELYDILKIGLRAGSPYNLQPWRFQQAENTLHIYSHIVGEGYKNFKDLPFYSLGPLLENITEGAQYYQYQTEYKLNPKFEEHQPLCHVTFTKDVGLQRTDITPIINRYTNRKSYKKTPPPNHVLTEIENVFQGPTQEIMDITNHIKLTENFGMSEGLRIKNIKLFRELIESLRFSLDDTLRTKDGLSLRTLDLHLNTTIYLHLAQIPFLTPIFSFNPLAYFLASYYHTLILQNTGLLLAFIDKNPTPENLVRDWMRIQKICNTLYGQGLQTQIVASSLDILKIPIDFYTPSEQSICRKVKENIVKMIGHEPKCILTLLRIGYASDVPIRALRHDPQDLFLPEK